MKNTWKWAGVLFLLLIVACSKDDDKQGGFAPQLMPDGEAQNVTRTTADLSGEVYAENMLFECGFMYSTASTVPAKDAVKVKAVQEETNRFGVTLTGLSPNTTYYYCMYASNGSNTIRSKEIYKFSTKPDGPPSLDISTVTQVSERSITVTSRILDDGGASIQSFGFGYRVIGDTKFTYVDAESYTNATTREYSMTIESLQPETAYEILASAINSKGRGEGAILTQKTLALRSPTVTTQAVTNITATSCVATGVLEDPGKGTVAEQGFMIVEKGSVNVPAKYPATLNKEDKTFSQAITGLKPNTTYLIYAYAQSVYQSETLIGQGATKEFSTLERSVPVVSTPACTEIDKENNSMVVTARVTDLKNGTLTTCGFYYSTTNKNPTVTDSPLPCEITKDNIITGTISGLMKNKTYYIRAYASNEEGEGVGNVLEVLPLPVGAIEFSEVKYSLKDDKLTLTSSITNTGDGTVGERGFLWSTTTSVPADMEKLVATGDNKAFAATLPEIKKDTRYYIRAYAVNENGQTNGNLLEITPIQVTIPTLGVVKATLNGKDLVLESSVTSASNGTISERGFMWSFNSGKTPAEMENKLQATGNDSKFTVTILNIEPNKTYYISAYAVNESGTGYGQVWHGAPLSISLPNMGEVKVTLQGKDILLESSVASGNSGTITERGFVWTFDKNVSPENMGNKVQTTGNDSKFTGIISNAEPNKTYYISAYAVNEVGTGYSRVWNGIPFAISRPTVSDVEYEVNGNIVIFKSKVVSTGNADVTERGFYWNTTNPDLTGTKLEATTGDNNGFSASMEIKANTTYYVRAYATNQGGTGKGNVMGRVLLSVAAPRVGNTTGKIEGKSVRLSSYATSDIPIEKVGFYYSTKGSPTTSDNFLPAPLGETFETILKDMEPDKTYYVRAYAEHLGVGRLGDEYRVVLSTPSIGEASVRSKTGTTLSLYVRLNNQGTGTVSKVGFCYSATNPKPKIEEDVSIEATSTNNFDYYGEILGLTIGTTYYVRSYAVNEYGIRYGSAVKIATKSKPGEGDIESPDKNN